MKQILIRAKDGASQVALLEDGRLAEYYMERSEEEERAGNIYKGRVVNVLPGMQSAFVDIGLEKNAFLYRDDLLPAHIDKQPAGKPSIGELVRAGQEIIVQVKKEPAGTKGARVTAHITLPGRWLVYMPDADYVAVSRKIEASDEKSRLKEIGERLRGRGDGLIIRTVAEGQGEQSMQQDWELLCGIWASVSKRAETSPAPSLLYHDLAMIPRLVRDLFSDRIDEIIVDDKETGRQLAGLLREMAPNLAPRVKHYSGGLPMFQAYPVAEQLDKAFRRKIALANGGYLVLDTTEALTVVDVNTGRFTGEDDLEKTVFETNLEAAEEIIRLLRLRDIGGMIVVDFIDMKHEENRTAVRKRMEEAAKADRTRTLLVGWTKLGLFELTRKKNRKALDGQFFDVCPYCGGAGKIHSKHHPHRSEP